MYSFRILLLVTCFIFFTTTSLLSVYILTSDSCPPCPEAAHILAPKSKPVQRQENDAVAQAGHRLAVLVPFRDRFDELLAFIPHLHKFLRKQNVNHDFHVLNQVDELRFNRASLINTGFKLTKDTTDYFVIHDVDLLPLWDGLSYSYPETGVFHVSSPQLHPKYHYPTFLGGILIIKRDVFEKVNGMSNRYWGWGLEDDELYTRLKDAQIVISRPPHHPSYNASNAFTHWHSGPRRRRDTRKCYNQTAVTRRRDRVTGLHNVSYNVTATVPMQVDGIKLTVHNVVLHCDRNATPWCQCAS